MAIEPRLLVTAPLVVRFCDECGVSFDAPRAATKTPVCDECREPRHQRLARERYRRRALTR